MVYQKMDEIDQEKEILSGMNKFKGINLCKVKVKKLKKNKIKSAAPDFVERADNIDVSLTSY